MGRLFSTESTEIDEKYGSTETLKSLSSALWKSLTGNTELGEHLLAATKRNFCLKKYHEIF